MTVDDALVLVRFGYDYPRLRRRVLPVLLGRASDERAADLPSYRAGTRLEAWLGELCHREPGYSHELRRFAETEATAAPRNGFWLLTAGGAGYPQALLDIPDPPAILWGQGSPGSLQAGGIALVGSRAASPHGLTMARRLAADLARLGQVIVSGLARGVDSAAHESCLEAGGRTVAVLGSGHRRLYPAEHRPLADRIVAAGAVVSEYAPDTPPRAHQFPARNRVISGLAKAVVVVEAHEKSGALITASCALEQGREVMVVPGPASNACNKGGHALLRDGAALVETAEDVLAVLGLLDRAAPRMPKTTDPGGQAPLLDGLARSTDSTVDEVARLTGLPPSEVLSGLLQLELAGRVQRVGGGRFVVRAP